MLALKCLNLRKTQVCEPQSLTLPSSEHAYGGPLKSDVRQQTPIHFYRMSTHKPKIIAAVALCAAGVVIATNYFQLQRPLSLALSKDPRNDGIYASAHYEYYIIPSTIIFNLKSVSPERSPADVTRILLQFAESQKSKDFSLVKLSHAGKDKFVLKGEYFKTLGQELEDQNPIYTIRTIPENLYKPDGTAAFGTWTGGLLGVVGKQMEDFAEFHRQWYISDLAEN